MLVLLRRRNVALLWWAGAISLTGDWLLNIGLPIVVYTLTGSALITSVVFIIELLPDLLLGSVAGVFVDRWNRRRTMLIVSLLQAVVLLPLLAVHAAAALWLVYFVSVGESVLRQFFVPAQSALLPVLVAEDELLTANSLLSLSNSLARLVGAPLGGVVVGLLGLNGVVLLDAGSFALAGAMIALIRAPAKPTREAARVAASVGAFWREWLEGLQFIWRQRRLAVLFVVEALGGFAQGIFLVLYLVFVLQVLRGGPEAVGLLRGVQAVGGLLGGVAVGMLGKRFSAARMLGLGTVLFGLFDLMIWNAPAFFPSLSLTAALFVVVGIPGVASGAGATTLLQVEAPDEFRGRVVGAFQATISLLLMGGLALAGALGDRFWVMPMLNVQGSMEVLAGVIALLFLGRCIATKGGLMAQGVGHANENCQASELGGGGA